MLIEEVRQYFGSSYNFAKQTSMHHGNYQNWKKQGYIPIKMQCRIEEVTAGKLKANYKHCSRSANESGEGLRNMEFEVQSIDSGIDSSGL